MDGAIQGRSWRTEVEDGTDDGRPAWVDQTLIQETLRTWGRYYPAGLTTKEAVEVIINVGLLFETLAVSQEDNR